MSPKVLDDICTSDSKRNTHIRIKLACRQRCNTHKQEKKGCMHSKGIASTIHVVHSILGRFAATIYTLSTLFH